MLNIGSFYQREKERGGGEGENLREKEKERERERKRERERESEREKPIIAKNPSKFLMRLNFKKKSSTFPSDYYLPKGGRCEQWLINLIPY